MKFCWWTNFPTPNERAMVGALRETGADVTVCYFMGKYDDYRRMIGWKDEGLLKGEFHAGSIRAARRQIVDFDDRVQVVPSYGDAISWRLMLYCILHRKPWIASVERSRGRWRSRAVVRLFAFIVNRFALKLFCIGGKTMEQYASLGVRREKLSWTGYAMPEFDNELVREMRNQRRGAVKFAFVGALSKRKAVDVLSQAFEKTRRVVPDVVLRVVGDGPMRQVFDGIVNVELKGAVPPAAVESLISDCDVIVLPSRYDPWGVALAEGARLGMAMIASDGTGASELICESPRNGYIVAAGDVEGLANAMTEYALHPEKARLHGEKAMESVKVVCARCLAKNVLKETESALGKR